MNKLTLAIALGTGLTLSAAAPVAARAGTISATTPTTDTTPTIQTLSTPGLSASTFSSLFSPIANAPVTNSAIDLNNSPGSGTTTNAGTISSQVFQGNAGTAAAGLYAYAYQLSANNTTNNLGAPVHIDSASWQFNATPTGTNFAGAGTPAYAYSITGGTIGGLTNAVASASGVGAVTPSTLSWQPGSQIGAIRADFVNPTTQTGPLGAGDNSATFVVISQQPFSQQFAGVLSSNPQSNTPLVYAATGGTISPVPVPEPTTILAWAGMAGALMLVRKARKAHAA